MTDRRYRGGLVAGRAGHVGPHHVFRRDAAEAAGVAEFLPVLRLVHPQARQVRRAADLHPGRAQGVRLAVRLVLEEHRAVTRVLQLDRNGRFALDRDRVLEDPHVLPRVAIFVLVRVRGVGVVDVQVLAVGAENRQAPRAVFVVADRHAWQRRLAAADHVPAWADQMRPVAQ